MAFVLRLSDTIERQLTLASRYYGQPKAALVRAATVAMLSADPKLSALLAKDMRERIDASVNDNAVLSHAARTPAS